ncbi:MAG TPA: NifU family protein [Gemmatimonadaceae bacterium]|nr:NifU family protein [Gemmatimonadaceae bacterium]
MRSPSRLTAEKHAALEARIRHELEHAGAILRLDHARLELLAFDVTSGVALLDVDGGCPDCELSVSTFHTAVAAHLRRAVPEVREVRLARD